MANVSQALPVDAVRETLAAERTPPFRWLVRAGFLARGITYGVIGGLVIALASGAASRSGHADQSGALSVVAQAPLGHAVLVVIALGLLAYALWKLAQAVIGSGPEGGGGVNARDRVANLGGAVAYLAFFAVALHVLFGSAANQSAQQRSATAGVLGWPGGSVLVALAGGCLIAISAYQVYEAWRARFLGDNKVSKMGPEERRVFTILGRIGLSARALVFVLVGYFLVKTAIDFKPSKGASLDGALAEVHRQPFGNVLLVLVALGLLVFAVYSFFEARYRRL